MRTTLTLDDDTYEAAEALARTSGKPLGKVVSELVRRGLLPQPYNVSVGLPCFAVPADAAIIPGMRAAELADDEVDV